MLKFKSMRKNEFDKYVKEAVMKIAEEYTTAGFCKKEESMDIAKTIFEQYLPNGLETEGQFLFNIVNDNEEKVGIIWYGIAKENEAFICDLIIFEKYRRKGYGKLAMTLLEEHVKSMGINKITLHVFGHNQPAIALYEKMGYKTFSMHMAKEI